MITPKPLNDSLRAVRMLISKPTVPLCLVSALSSPALAQTPSDPPQAESSSTAPSETPPEPREGPTLPTAPTIEDPRKTLADQKAELEQTATQSAQQFSSDVQAQAQAEVQELKAQVMQLKAEAERIRDDAKDQLEQKKTEVIQSVLERTRVESDQFTFGVFPNSAGFMDARLHARTHYLDTLSSGVYLDYTTARAVQESGLESRADRLIREYRGEIDLIKGILLLADSPGLAWSVEPGANGKVIHQDIDDSGFNTNSFDETVFQSSNLRVTQLVSSAKLDTTLVVKKDFLFDFSGEYLPFIYQLQNGTTVTSQFDQPVDYSLENHTSGYQFQGKLTWDAERYGKFALRALAYRAEGSVSARSSLVSGNFEYTFETFNNAKRIDTWAEFIHTASYVRLFGNLAPAVAFAFQRKQIITSEDSLSADTYKIGFLLEWQ